MDFAKCKGDKHVDELLSPGETIIVSDTITKYNHVGKVQQRILLVTNRTIYNLSVPSLFNSLFNKIVSRINRKTSLKNVVGVTVSRYGLEFVIHVENEHDYRISSEKHKKELLMGLCEAYCQFHKRNLAFFFKEEYTLDKYCTTKIDVKENKFKKPKEPPQHLNVQALKHSDVFQPKTEKTFVKPDNPKQISIQSFQPLKVLGRGIYGKVMLCQMKETKKYYAIKSMRKEEIIEMDHFQRTKSQKYFLEKADHPFIISLEYSFESKQKIFFVMRFIRGGDLYQYLHEKTKFTEEVAQFYAAQILLGIEYIQNEGYVYRDLKPENIMIGEDGYIVLTDFGLAKHLDKNTKSYSFAGTPEYMAPEIIKSLGHDGSVDWWSFGILIFEMLTGTVPFNHPNQNILFQEIIQKEVDFPTGISDSARNLITRLLKKKQNQRLGSKGVSEIKYHPWFNSINWGDILSKKAKAPYIPQLKSDILDVSHFDKQFTEESAQFSYVPPNNFLLNRFDDEFKDMSFGGCFKKSKIKEK